MVLQRERPKLVLASGSATRAMLLEAAGLAFSVCPAELDEEKVRKAARKAGLDGGAAALRLAEEKARSVGERAGEALVIAADQMLVCGGRWFSKPRNRGEAVRQLQALRGRTHRLPTAVACSLGAELRWSHVSEARLTFRSFSDAALEAVLDADPSGMLGSVGGYRLEGAGVLLCERIEGDHFSILGLPLLPLLGFLRAQDVLVD